MRKTRNTFAVIFWLVGVCAAATGYPILGIGLVVGGWMTYAWKSDRYIDISIKGK